MVLVQSDLFAYIYGSIRIALLAKHSNDSDAVALAYSKYGANMSLSGVIGQFLGSRYTRESQGRLDQCKSMFVRAISTQNIASARYYAGNLDAAERYLADSQPELDKITDWHAGLNLHMLRHIASQRGDAKEIGALAHRELEFGEKIKDPILQAWGKYGLSDALSRNGEFEKAINYARESYSTLEKSLTRSVAAQELGRALIQASRYAEAEETLRVGLKLLRTDLFYFDFSMQNYSLFPEAIIGPEWSRGPTVISKDARTRGSRAASRARFWAMLFPNMRAHTYRVSGRVAAACGKARLAIKYFDRALVDAKKFGNRGEYARTLIDKSQVISGDEALKLREEGLRLLNELHTVLPEAEIAVLESIRKDRNEPRTQIKK
jgi:tetratricopeptide (TPR) repeat protein